MSASSALIACGLLANADETAPPARAFWWAVGIIGFAVGLYHWWNYMELVNRAGELTDADMVVGIAALAVLFLLVWRAMGIALPLVAGTFLAYCLFGRYLPAPFDHRGYSLEQVIEQMAFGTEGLYATPTAVSATFIFLFILFGAFMERAGVIDFFNDISMAVFGGKQGGPGKVCVASSALMGTVSGSGVANVVASGQFTIPLMKRSGFNGAFAGGVEATSSMGGQIMPPVMGAVAFIMAETIDVPYSKIVEAAIIPAFLYFAACYWAVHLEAGKLGLTGPAEIGAAERPRRTAQELVPDRAAPGAGLSPVRGLHAALRGRDRPCPHRRPHPRAGDFRRPHDAGAADRLLGRLRADLGRVDGDQRCDRARRRPAARHLERAARPLRARGPERLHRGSRRRRAPGAAGRPRLRAGRHRHRHHDVEPGSARSSGPG